MNKTYKKCVWSPWNTIIQNTIPNVYGVIILNRPINFNFSNNYIINIWNNASLRVTVDGGTDRWLSWIKSNNIDTNLVAKPDLITGDMDSISSSTLQYFHTCNSSKVIFTEDQNETDFTKAVIESQKFCHRDNIKLESIIVFTEISGRFDQLISNINTLFKAPNIIDGCKLYLLSPDSLTWLLEEGDHDIEIPLQLRENKEWCGLLPMGSSCQVTTSGLKWDLNKSILEFGNLVSTSNTYNGMELVKIHTDSPIIWTMGIESLI